MSRYNPSDWPSGHCPDDLPSAYSEPDSDVYDFDTVVSKSPEGWPLNAAHEVVMSQCSTEMKREIYERLVPKVNLLVRRAS